MTAFALVWRRIGAVCFAIALSSSAGFGQDPAARALATVLIASDLADLCGRYVKRLGPQSHKDFVVAGIRQLEKDGHSLGDLDRVPLEVSQRQMYEIMEDLLVRRGVRYKDTRAVCLFARQIAGQNDSIGRFLIRR